MAALAASACAQSAQVRTASGSVEGSVLKSTGVQVYKGIPFAAPPVGDLRWAEPQPVKPWTGVKPAKEFSASCMQSTTSERLPWSAEYLVHNPVSEDCLYLNVWTPKHTSANPLPVVVYIHGGGFTEGSGGVAIYDGEPLAASGLVVVTINYRLGVFGFLAHPELTARSPHHVSGNWALMDQIAALRWVQANIAAFGGDPKRVTIWGQSAGAFSVAGLLASPEAKGLFARAMASSGIGAVALPMTPLKDAEQAGLRFAQAHKAASLKELLALPAADLLPGPQDASMGFMPIEDGWILPDSPADLSAKRADSDVPVVTGYMANDGALFTMPMASVDAYAKMVAARYGEMAAEYLKLYPAATVEAAQTALIEASRDRNRVSAWLWATQRTANHSQPVYTYYFDRAIPWPAHPEFGAFHSGELPYFFGNQALLDRPWQSVDRELAKNAMGYLQAFAAAGDPNAKGLPPWLAARASAPATEELGAHTGAMPLASAEKLDFWKRFFSSPAAAHASVF
jgi:para-nitrobenzyl esterase